MGAAVDTGVAEFEEGAESGVEGFGVLAGALEGPLDGLAAGGRVVGGCGAQSPPGAVDAGEVVVGEAGDEFAEGGEVAEGDGDLDGAVVGADAFGAAVAGEFGVDGEGAGLQFLDGVAVGLDEVEGGGVAVSEAVEGGAAVGAPSGEGDGDAGDFGVDFEVGFASDGDVGVVGVP